MTSVAISPNGQWVAASGIASAIRVLDRASGRVRHQFSKSSTSGVVFLSSSDVVYSGTPDGTICQWSMAGGRLVVFGKANRVHFSGRELNLEPKEKNRPHPWGRPHPAPSVESRPSGCRFEFVVRVIRRATKV